jgi:CRISPR system Cascade subunit CasE
VDVAERLRLRTLEAGERFRFRLRANPCVTRDGKRLGLLRLQDQEAWLIRKGEMHGFVVPLLPSTPTEDSVPARADVRVTHQQMLRGKQHSGNGIRVFSVLYDGVLRVADPDRFRAALHSGIGHGKALGLGPLSLARIA